MGNYLGFYNTGLWLAKNDGMDRYSNPYIIHYNSFQVSMFVSIHSFPAHKCIPRPE